MAAILKPAFLKSMTPSNIISGFQSTGIYPYNPDVITEDDYSLLQPMPLEDLTGVQVGSPQATHSRLLPASWRHQKATPPPASWRHRPLLV